jgi:hypothetical protein
MTDPSTFSIKDGVVDTVRLHSHLPAHLRPDFLPFVVAYGVLIVPVLTDHEFKVFDCLLGIVNI